MRRRTRSVQVLAGATILVLFGMAGVFLPGSRMLSRVAYAQDRKVPISPAKTVEVASPAQEVAQVPAEPAGSPVAPPAGNGGFFPPGEDFPRANAPAAPA